MVLVAKECGVDSKKERYNVLTQVMKIGEGAKGRRTSR